MGGQVDHKALSGLRVIDLTRYTAGPYCTKLMAGFGADVIKIERPGKGDPMRSIGPFCENGRGAAESVPFLWLNTGKRGLTLDLKTSRGRALLERLAAGADALVENFSPGVMARLGLGYERLAEINPGLVVTSISNFGQTGPYRDYRATEMVAQAMSGIMHMTGSADGEPLASGPALCQYSAGLHAYTATLMALFQRRSAGTGQHVDVSIMECGMEHIELTLSAFLQERRCGRRGGHMMAPWDLFKCSDGWAAIVSAPMRHWLKGASIFEEPRLFDERFRTAIGRSANRTEVDSLIRPWLESTPKMEVFRKGQEKRLAFGYLASIAEASESPQHIHRGFFAEVDHPSTGARRYPSAPFKMSATPWEDLRAPLLGEHNEEVLCGSLGLGASELALLREEGVV